MISFPGSSTDKAGSVLSKMMRFGETPVPIPNTTVKPKTAESTALETVCGRVGGRQLQKEKKEPGWKQAEAFGI